MLNPATLEVLIAAILAGGTNIEATEDTAAIRVETYRTVLARLRETGGVLPDATGNTRCG